MIKHIDDLELENTSHLLAKRKVFLKNNELKNKLTQIAYGFLEKGNKVESHKHYDMYEYFYVVSGSGEFIADDQTYKLRTGHFFEIEPGILHAIIASDNEDLNFIYWGIIEKESASL